MSERPKSVPTTTEKDVFIFSEAQLLILNALLHKFQHEGRLTPDERKELGEIYNAARVRVFVTNWNN